MSQRRKRSNGSRDDWRTPPNFFAGVNDRFRFTGDAFASEENALCDRFMDGTTGRDALIDDWYPQLGPRPWVQPMYSRLGECMARLVELWHGSTRVRPVTSGFEVAAALIPINMETKPWQEGARASSLPGVLGAASEVWIVRRRIGFIDPATGEAASQNPIGSAVVVFDYRHRLGVSPRLGSLCAKTGRPTLAHDWDYWESEASALRASIGPLMTPEGRKLML